MEGEDDQWPDGASALDGIDKNKDPSGRVTLDGRTLRLWARGTGHVMRSTIDALRRGLTPREVLKNALLAGKGVLSKIETGVIERGLEDHKTLDLAVDEVQRVFGDRIDPDQAHHYGLLAEEWPVIVWRSYLKK